MEFVKIVFNEMKESLSLSRWCNSWGREMGIYGNIDNNTRKGVDDDLDAFRHAFAHSVAVSLNPVGVPSFDKQLAELLGELNERFNSTDECAKAMDLYNNSIGQNLAVNNGQVLFWLALNENPVRKIAEIIAEDVKSGITVNSLDDPRIKEQCKKKGGKQGKYIWRTVKDGRVRRAHAMREGRVFEFENPPEGGNPGDEYGCRCIAELVPEKSLEEIFGQ